MSTPEELAAQEAETKAQEAAAKAKEEQETKIKAEAEAKAKEEEQLMNGEKFDPERAKALIEKLRSEVKDLKPKAKKADELEAAEQKRKEAEMSELEKAQKHAAELEAKVKEADLREMRRKVGTKHKLPEAVYELLPDLPEAEMEAKAAELAKAVTTKQTPDIKITNPNGSPNKTTNDAQWRDFMNGGPLPT